MNNFLVFFITFLVALVFAPFYIKFSKKLKFGQNILHYVNEHNYKQGTSTMGGVIFILPVILISLFFMKGNLIVPILTLFVFLGYGIVGFLDDFIKIKFKRNLGLRAYQKIIFQLVLALIVAIFLYKNGVFSQIYLPFSDKILDLKWLIIPFSILVFVSTTNSVNLTDGLDGLAGSVSFVFFVTIATISSLLLKNNPIMSNQDYFLTIQNLNTICFSCAGALLSFLIFNFYPAKIFMGDTGSLALGGLMACVCLFSGTSLYILIVGFMFVVSSVSVIIQVLHYKRTKKRIFLMAPFHHHLQHKGMYETKIVFIYIVITIVLSFFSIALLGGL